MPPPAGETIADRLTPFARRRLELVMGELGAEPLIGASPSGRGENVDPALVERFAELTSGLEDPQPYELVGRAGRWRGGRLDRGTGSGEEHERHGQRGEAASHAATLTRIGRRS
jgi:hypothetical protein